MAVVTVLSQQMTNATATPATPNPAYQDGGRVRCKRAVCSVANGDSANSKFKFFRIKSGDMVKDVVLDNESLGAGAAGNVGLYKVDGTVVDADFFASAVDLSTANRNVSVYRESGVITVANMEKRVWEALGLSSDPQIEYDVVITLTGAAAAAGKVCLTAEVVGGY